MVARRASSESADWNSRSSRGRTGGEVSEFGTVPA